MFTIVDLRQFKTESLRTYFIGILRVKIVRLSNNCTCKQLSERDLNEIKEAGYSLFLAEKYSVYDPNTKDAKYYLDC